MGRLIDEHAGGARFANAISRFMSLSYSACRSNAAPFRLARLRGSSACIDDVLGRAVPFQS